MNKIISLSVKSEENNQRVDVFISKKENLLSRTRIKNLILKNKLKLNNRVIVNPSKKVSTGDKLVLEIPEPKKTSLKPYDFKLDIIYEDENLLIINKPAGIVMHPGAGNYDNTIVNGLLYKYHNKLSGIGGKLRPGIVHRIDKDTSGVIVVAKNDNAHINLSQQFSEHTIKRTYEALIWGSLKPQNGVIREKISRSIRNRQLMSVRKEKGKIAITNYKTLKIFHNSNLPKISLIECKLETGRTHQIRVHMKFKGNPIIGDKSYGKLKKNFKKIDPSIEKKINNFNRQALHAKSLGFLHPGTKKEVFFEARRPTDFDTLIKNLDKVSV